jgi:hypothetical protein
MLINYKIKEKLSIIKDRHQDKQVRHKFMTHTFRSRLPKHRDSTPKMPLRRRGTEQKLHLLVGERP